jgi:hypothetical protein
MPSAINILMVSFDDQRWGPSRLPQPLSEAGFHVAALCPKDNPLARTRFLEAWFPLVDVQASDQIEAALARALRAWWPRLIIPGDERAVACLYGLARRTGPGGPDRLTPAERAMICASMAPIDRLEAMLIKDATLALAREVGVPTPDRSAVDAQKVIAGTPAVYCAAALGGRLAAGFAGVTRPAGSAPGPGGVVWIGAHAAMAAAAAEMISALGASGFIGFDFMLEAESGRVLLLECHPRPMQICHLGPLIGVDLCAALARALNGEHGGPGAAASERTVPLFPQEWLRDPGVMACDQASIDVPWTDPDLLRMMVSAPAA